MTEPLLILGHAADRTGPPVYLLHLLRWLREHRPDAAVEVVLLAGGDLLDELAALAPVTVFPPLPPTLPPTEQVLVERGLVDEGAAWARERALALRDLMGPHAARRVAYVSCAPAIELAQALPSPPEVLLCHVHELATGLIRRMRPLERHLFLAGATRLFSVAEAVTDELVRLHGRDRSVIDAHHEMIDVEAIVAETAASDVADERRTRGIDPDAHVVVACGSVETRKGTDLLLRVAGQLGRRGLERPVTVLWVGGGPTEVARAEERARVLGVADVVRFVGPQPDPAAWFALADVFVLPSREDPFPLVCIEALAAGTPVVAFDTGGIPELLRLGCGEVVPYPDVTAMADSLAGLLSDPERRTSLGEAGRDAVRARHDVSVVAPRLWSAIEEHL